MGFCCLLSGQDEVRTPSDNFTQKLSKKQIKMRQFIFLWMVTASWVGCINRSGFIEDIKSIRTEYNTDKCLTYITVFLGNQYLLTDTIDECKIDDVKHLVAKKINSMPNSGFLPEEKILFAFENSNEIKILIDEIVNEKFKVINKVLHKRQFHLDSTNIKTFISGLGLLNFNDTNSVFFNVSSNSFFKLLNRYDDKLIYKVRDVLSYKGTEYLENAYFLTNKAILNNIDRNDSMNYILSYLTYSPNRDTYYLFKLCPEKDKVSIKVILLNPYSYVDRALIKID